MPPGLLERYKVVRALGRGAMGVVAAVEDLELGRVVALKLSTVLGNDMARARFLREAQAAASIRHPNVIDIYDCGIMDDIPYLTMELVEGHALDEPPPPEDPEAVFWQVAEALEEVHARELVHRDVKPGNIMLAGERVLLTDFGLVHDPNRTALTQEGMAPGTIAFLAPELFQGEPTSPSADWWALGVTIFRLVEDRIPFEFEQVMAFAGGVERPLPEFTRIPEDSRLARMARAWTSWEPGDRPASVAAMRAVLGDEEVPVPGPDTEKSMAVPAVRAPVPHPPASPGGVPKAALLGGLLLLGMAAGAALAPGGAPTQEPSPGSPAPASTPTGPPSEVQLALEALDDPAIQDRLLDLDPQVWARTLGEVPALERLRSRLEDPEARSGLERIDARLRSLELPPLFAPHLRDDAPTPAPRVEDFPRRRPFNGVPEFWPASPGPHLARAGREAIRLDAAYQQLLAEMKAAERDGSTSPRFPFDGAGTNWFAVNGWDVARGQLESQVDVRQRAEAWFRPSVDAYRDMVAALARSIQSEPGTRGAAVLLASEVTGLTSKILHAGIGVLDVRWHQGLEPRTDEAWALRSVLLDRIISTEYRNRIPPPEALSRFSEALARALAQPGQDFLGAWVRASLQNMVARGSAYRSETPELPGNWSEHLSAAFEHLPAGSVAALLRLQLIAQKRSKGYPRIEVREARRALEFLEAHPDAWEGRSEEERLRHRKALEAAAQEDDG
jgi:serine/threonine protein kinase